MNGRGILIAEYGIAIGMVFWSQYKTNQLLPPPSRMIKASLAYGLLGVAAPFISPQVAGALGAGLLMALIYNTVGTGTVPVGTDNNDFSGH